MIAPLSVGTLALALGVASTLTVTSGLTSVELDAALAGKVPTRAETFTNEQGKSAGRGTGAIVIERSIKDVWTTLSAFEKRVEYMPRIKSLVVLEHSATRARIRQEIDASVTTARYTAWYELDEPNHTIRWTLDKSAPGNTVVNVEGDYRAFELGPTRTLLVYRASVDSGLRVPRFVQNYMTTKSIPDLLHALKQRVESGDTYTRK